MEQQKIVKQINNLIEDVLNDLYEVFDKLKIVHKSECEELHDMIVIKRRYNKVMDGILTIYNQIVKLKYMELQKRKIDKNEIKKDVIIEFEKLMKTLD